MLFELARMKLKSAKAKRKALIDFISIIINIYKIYINLDDNDKTFFHL